MYCLFKHSDMLVYKRFMSTEGPVDTIAQAFAAYTRFQSVLDDLFAGIQVGPNTGLVNLEMMGVIHQNMGKICELYSSLHGSAIDMYSRIQSLHARYSANVDRIQAFMGTRLKTEDSVDAAWTLKTRRGTRVLPPPGFDIKVPIPPAPTPLQPTPSGYYAKTTPMTAARPRVTPSATPTVPVPITDNIELNAIRVPGFDGVTTNGDLYYIESCNHFAFRVSGVLFHAGIGDIYTTESEPVKIKECKYGDKCNRHDCTYYHDPIRCDNSRDIRNYVANSWLYAPPGSLLRTRKTSRVFGSRQFLDSDVSGVDGEDIRRFMDQSSHDILCSLILSRYATAS